MSKKAETYGYQKDGTFKISYRDEFWQSVKNMGDGRFRVTIEKIYRKQSSSQRAYYFGVIVHEFCEGYYETTGEKISTEQAHEILKTECNGKEIVNKETGEIFTIPLSTANLTTVETMEYYERCIKFIAEWFGRTVNAPNEQSELTFKK